MTFNPGNKRLQNALYGAAPSSDGGVQTVPNGRGGTVTVTNGSVMNFGGVDKFGLYPTVGVSIGFLLKLSACCPPGSTANCYNTIQQPSGCNSFLM